MQPVHIRQYFQPPELIEAITAGKIETVTERDFAHNLFTLEPPKVIQLLPLYFEGIERLKFDTPAKPDPKTAHLQFERGAPTWLRLAWKCRVAYEKGGVQKLTTAESQEKAKAFFTKHKDVIDAQEKKKYDHTRIVHELFKEASEEFFATLCGKPHAHEPYATNKLLAKNIFAITEPVRFTQTFNTYASTLLIHKRETKLHPELVQDLISRLVKYVKDEKHPERHLRLNDASRKLLSDIAA